MASQPKKLRILCLHGFTQNEWKFADSVAKISEGLKDMVEFTFLTGTTVLPSKSNKDDNSDNKSQENDDPKKSRTCWWRSNDDNSVYVGLQDAIMAVSKAIEEKGPFDGIMVIYIVYIIIFIFKSNEIN